MRKYYILDETVNGVCPSVDTTEEGTRNANIAGFFEHYKDKVDPGSLHLQFKLRYHAKFTDFLSSLTGSNTSYIISDRARRILDTSYLMRHIYFDASIIREDKEYRYNYLSLMRQDSLLDFIDYEKSVFIEKEWADDKGPIRIKSYAHYESLKSSASEPAAFGVRIEKLVMTDSFDRSLDMFYLCPFSIDVYVSEDLRYKLEESKITGICFNGPVLL